MRTTIDLATELGESFALPPAGIPLHFLRQQTIEGRTLHPRHGIAREDDMLLGLVSTGYVACGAHAGDPVVMGRTVRLLAERGIAVGAHPSYPDIFGFGQLPVDLQDNEIQDVLLTQVAALAAIARAVGTRVSSVKCHGSLAFDVSYDERTVQVAARALHRFDPGISLVCMAGSPGARVARDCDIPVIEEAYIDRGYDRTGRIVSRTHPKALITDPREAAAQFNDIAQHSRLKTVAAKPSGFMRIASACTAIRPMPAPSRMPWLQHWRLRNLPLNRHFPRAMRELIEHARTHITEKRM